MRKIRRVHDIHGPRELRDTSSGPHHPGKRALHTSRPHAVRTTPPTAGIRYAVSLEFSLNQQM